MVSFLSASCVLFALSASGAEIPALPLPSYIGKGCLRNDPKLNECIVRKGAPAIIKVAQGDPKYRIPRLDPLVLNELVIGRGTRQVGLTLSCKNCTLNGLENTKFIAANVNLKKPVKTAEWKMHLDQLNVLGKYNVDGQVLLLPINGKGNLNLTCTKIDFVFKYEWTNIKKSNGLHYTKLRNSHLDFNIGGMNIHLDNLFNGDKLLGESMNNFLNENWQELVKEIKPALTSALSDVFTRVLNNMAEVVPYENIFPKE